VTLAIWIVGLLAWTAAVWLLRVLRLSHSRRRLVIWLAALASGLTLLFWLSSERWVLAIPIAALMFSFVVVLSAYAWKVDALLTERTERTLSHHPRAQDRFEKSRLLAKLRKRR
jgi:hypothetical protein